MKSDTFRASGLVLETLESGTSEKLAVLFCHGNSSSALSFRPVLQSSLSEHAHLVSISLPGHGRSQRASVSTDYSLGALNEVLAEWVRSQTAEKIVVCGHSLGGHLFSQALEQCRVDGVVLVSAPPLSVETLGQTFLPDPTGGAMFGAELDQGAIERFAGSLLQSPPAAPEDNKVLLESIARTAPTFRPALGASIMAGDFGDERSFLQAAAVPVAIVAGSEDRFIQAEAYKSVQLERLWRGKAQIFEGCGHSPHLENPSAFISLMAAFLDDLASPT